MSYKNPTTGKFPEGVESTDAAAIVKENPATGGAVPRPEANCPTPGDRCKISDLVAGDVFESCIVCYYVIDSRNVIALDFHSLFSLIAIEKIAKSYNDNLTYLGKLTAEMVRGLLKK